MDILTSLHKSLQPHWTTQILCRNIVNLSNSNKLDVFLEGIKTSFTSYDNKVKLRILLSFLGVKMEIISSQAVLIKQILEQASNTNHYDMWVTNIAGLVHRRLFPNTTGTSFNSIEESINIGLTDILTSVMTSIHNNIASSASSDEYQHITGDNCEFFQSFESLYTNVSLNHNELKNPHYTSTNKEPNFLDDEIKRSNERNAAGKRSYALAESVHKRTQLSDRTFSSGPRNIANQGSKPRLIASITEGLGINSSQHRKPIQKLDLAQMEKIDDSKTIRHPGNVKMEESGPAKKKLKVGDVSDVNAITPSMKEAGASQVTSKSQSNIDVLKPHVQGSSLNNPLNQTDAVKFPDLNALFSESPLLSASDKEIIVKFFSPEGPMLFPPETKEMKFNLQQQENVNADGHPVIETIKLRLICNPKITWLKVKSSKVMNKTKPTV